MDYGLGLGLGSWVRIDLGLWIMSYGLLVRAGVRVMGYGLGLSWCYRLWAMSYGLGL